MVQVTKKPSEINGLLGCLGSTHILCFCGGESNCGLLLGTPRDGCSIGHEDIASCGPPVLSSTPVSIHITREGDLPSPFGVGDGGGRVLEFKLRLPTYSIKVLAVN
jgi:hypothetical protein